MRYRPSKRLVDDSYAFSLDSANREVARDILAIATPTQLAKNAQALYYEQLERMEKRIEKSNKKAEKIESDKPILYSELSTFRIL